MVIHIETGRMTQGKKVYDIVQEIETVIVNGEKDDYLLQEISRIEIISDTKELEVENLLAKIKDLEDRLKIQEEKP